MRNFTAPGDRLTFTAAADISSGDGVLVGQIFGVVTGDVASGEQGTLSLTGVYSLPKATGQAWAAGDPIYWDASAGECTTDPDAATLIGAATAVALAGDTSGTVRLNGIAGAGKVAGFEMSASPGGANVSEVTITAKDEAGRTVAEPVVFDLWLSDNADGGWLTATAASGTVQAKASEGQVFTEMAAKKALRVQTLNTGSFTLEITDTAKTAFVVCAQAPGTGRTIPGLTLSASDYG